MKHKIGNFVEKVVGNETSFYSRKMIVDDFLIGTRLKRVKYEKAKFLPGKLEDILKKLDNMAKITTF
ncbi:MAG: hypothetical protein OEZ13_05350 [Spirochaetia bacterium]|nr:hypothetical protein [Spirochaetia bacterium]